MEIFHDDLDTLAMASLMLFFLLLILAAIFVGSLVVKALHDLMASG